MHRLLVIHSIVTIVAVVGTELRAAPTAKREQPIGLAVTANGFEPSTIHLKAGQPVRLVVARTTARTCATAVGIRDLGIRRTLPLNKAVEIRFTPNGASSFHDACAMDMVAGGVLVE